jgi:hypothetical protein
MIDYTFTVYDPTSGKIISNFFTNDPSLIQLNVGSSSYIQGKYNGSEYYIQDGQPVAIPADPSSGVLSYQFDYNTKSWALNIPTTEQNVRLQRNGRLLDVDNVSALRLSLLTDAQKQELIDYRQALLDVPQQSGFPTDVSWPNKPTWL